MVRDILSPEILKLVDTAGLDKLTLFTSAARSELVTVTAPTPATGICTGTENSHDSPTPKEPPEKVSKPVPEIEDVAPQTLVKGNPVETKPEAAASKSTVKAIFSAKAELFEEWLSLKSREVGSPGSTELSARLIEKLGALSNENETLAEVEPDTTFCPLIDADIACE